MKKKKINIKQLAVKILIQVAIQAVVIITTAYVTKRILLPEEVNDIGDTIEAKEYANTHTEPFGPVLPSFESILEKGLPDVYNDPELRKLLEDLIKEDPRAVMILERADEYPEELLKGICYYPDLLDYALAYPDAEPKVTGGFTKEELSQEHPKILQFDTRWGFYPYGDGDIARCGCAPTALSIAVLEATNNADVTPDVVADLCMEKGLYVEGFGTDWTLFVLHEESFGVDGQVLNIGKQNMIDALNAGHPVILSVGPGDFTGNGHIVVVVDYKDGKFVITDPASTKRSNMLWSFEELLPQIKQLWEISPLK